MTVHQLSCALTIQDHSRYLLETTRERGGERERKGEERGRERENYNLFQTKYELLPQEGRNPSLVGSLKHVEEEVTSVEDYPLNEEVAHPLNEWAVLPSEVVVVLHEMVPMAVEAVNNISSSCEKLLCTGFGKAGRTS